MGKGYTFGDLGEGSSFHTLVSMASSSVWVRVRFGVRDDPRVATTFTNHTQHRPHTQHTHWVRVRVRVNNNIQISHTHQHVHIETSRQ